MDLRDLKLKYWIAISFVLALIIVIGIPAMKFETFGVASTRYEGPAQEFVAVGFENQPAHSGWSSYQLNGIYSAGTQPDKASVWNWGDPSNVIIDPDGAKRGIPNLGFYASPFTVINKNGEKASYDHVIRVIEYDIYHNGKTYRVQQFLVYFRSYVKFTASGVEDLTGPLVDEVDFPVECDVYLHLGINKWGSRAEADHIWAGILQIEVMKVDRNDEHGQRSDVSPSSASQISMLSDIRGQQIQTQTFDQFKSGWQNPDRVPNDIYYKLHITNFKVGKHAGVGKLLQPYAMFEIYVHVLVSHRFVLTKENEARYEDQVPNVGYDYLWERFLEDLLDKFGLDPTMLLILIAGIIIAFLTIAGMGVLVLVVVLRD